MLHRWHINFNEENSQVCMYPTGCVTHGEVITIFYTMKVMCNTHILHSNLYTIVYSDHKSELPLSQIFSTAIIKYDHLHL